MKKLHFAILAIGLMASCTPESSIYLDELDLSTMGAGWGTPKSNKSITDGTISINNKQFERGIGTHALSTWLLALDGKSTVFSASVGVDDAASEEASIKFYLFGDQKLLWESELLKWGQDAEVCEVGIKGVKKLGLLVTGADDGINFDHANWAEAKISYKKVAPAVIVSEPEAEYMLTPPAPASPRINGSRVTGVRPGSPFLYRIPASGDRPMEFSIDHLPDGLKLNTSDGIVTGKIGERGRYKLEITASNKAGSDKKEFTIVVGDTLALTPHMGWNSWYIHYDRVSEAIMREAADQMIATGMADYGYQYVNIDDCWMVKLNSDDPEIGGPLRDKSGKLLTNKRFPDIVGMTDYIHEKGLLAGTYISPGPNTCAGYAGSYQHEAQDARTFADWGFDFLKYDWCSYGSVEPHETRADYIAPYKLMWGELQKQKRDIVLNLCQYGMDNVWEWGGNVGNSWRTTGDLGLANGGTMPGFYYIGRTNADHWEYARPGNWNDPDYILIGYVGSAFKMGEGVKTSLSPSEQYSYMSMWSLMAAPLIFSGDMAKLDPFTLNILCNHEVISIDQDPLGKQGRIIREENDQLVIMKDLEDGSKAVGLFHVSGAQKELVDYFLWEQINSVKMAISAEDLGMSDQFLVRDVWRQEDLGAFSGTFEIDVPYHGVALLQISDGNL